MGTSGSGKTTLMNVLSTIDPLTSGNLEIMGKSIYDLSDNQKAKIRKEAIGFIFQSFNLIDSLSIKDNILFSIRLNGASKQEQDQRLEEVSKSLNINEILDKYPYECSGGQQQRAAIARVLVSKPKIIFADEPTGNLDSVMAREIMTYFTKINQELNTTIVMVTHDSFVASYSSHLYYVEDGKITHTLERNNQNQEEYYNQIATLNLNIKI